MQKNMTFKSVFLNQKKERKKKKELVYLIIRYTPSLNKSIFSKNNSGNFQAKSFEFSSSLNYGSHWHEHVFSGFQLNTCWELMHLFLHLYQLIVSVNAAHISTTQSGSEILCITWLQYFNLLYQHTFCQQHFITVSGFYLEEPKNEWKKINHHIFLIISLFCSCKEQP